MINPAAKEPSFDDPVFPIALLDLGEKFFERRNRKLSALYQRCCITPAQISRKDAHITGWQFRELFRACKEIAMPSPPLSVQLAEFVPITVPGGMFGLASFTAKNVKQALEVMTDFAYTVMPAYHFEVLSTGQQQHIILRPAMDFGDVQRELDESVCGYVLNLRLFAQLPDPPVRVSLRHEPLGNLADYEKQFAAKFYFSQNLLELVFEKHHLMQPLYTHNQSTFDQVYSSLRNTCDREQGSSTPTATRVRKLLGERLAVGMPLNIQALAETMNISERTLARRLHQEQSSFVDIKQQVSIDYAKFLLESSEQPICKIAQASGYTSDSNFSRAFKAVTGLTPKQFRSGS
ncbi:helix-turn-helix domain-containing protein [Spongiibacter sp. KMU-158]|uniref:Helix-turn-helix domain-containing protein n=1 Tax=Spongiibacter pelagi TaxID=2760804 RepID=A0A927C194_9GAMM|nr:AraC family transcriptional regulator [Spongiibacter pelagi]MBD2859409.1 helix-turn-helix domain-containing protein [Spongiibacter pelagi]